MNTKQTIAIAALLAVTSSAFALNCKNAQTQAALRQCSAQDYEREDSRLNKTYRALMGRLDGAGQTKLQEVQESWVKYQDLHCEYMAAQYEGGSMQPLVLSTCLTDLAKQRNKVLREMLKEGSM